MWGDEVGQAVVYQRCLANGQSARFSHGPSTDEGAPAHIKNVYSTLINKEPFKQALDDDQPLAKDQHDRVDPCPRTAVEDEEEQQLWQEGEGEEQKVDEKRDDGQRKQAADEKRVKLGMT